jgi:hypothetical protein
VASAPEIEYRADVVIVKMSIRTYRGTCPGDDNSFETVTLSEPLGQRTLMDGADHEIEWQPQAGLVPIPQQDVPNVQCYPTYLEGAYLAGSPGDESVAWVESAEGQRVNVRWPAGYSARFTPEIELVGPIGQAIARAGDELTLAGGFVPGGEFSACGVNVGPLEIGGDPMPWPTTDPASTTRPGATFPIEATLPWRIDPDSPPAVGDTEIHVLLHETGCTGGRDPREHLKAPEFATNDRQQLIITLTVTFDRDFATCPGNPEVPYVVELPQPLSDSPLFDGASGSTGMRWTPDAQDADLVGRLVSTDQVGCSLILHSGGQRFEVQWPAGYWVFSLGDEHALVNPSGERVAYTGDDIALRGAVQDDFGCMAGPRFVTDDIAAISRNNPP